MSEPGPYLGLVLESDPDFIPFLDGITGDREGVCDRARPGDCRSELCRDPVTEIPTILVRMMYVEVVEVETRLPVVEGRERGRERGRRMRTKE